MKLKDNLNRKYTQISIYVIITAIIIYCLSLIAKNAPVIWEMIWDKVSWIIRVTQPVILGFVFAYLLYPVVGFIERQYQKLKFFKRKKSWRGIAVFSTILLVLFAIIAVFSLLISSITDQLKLANMDDILELGIKYSKIFEDFYATARDKLLQLDIESVELEKYIREVGNYLIAGVQEFGSKMLGSVGNISGTITTFLFSLIITIYFLIDGNKIQEFLKRVARALLSDRVNKKMKEFLDDADSVFSGYIRGQLMDALVMMILISITLTLIGVDFAVVIGIFAGIGNLIPYCGPFVAYAGTILVCLVNGDFSKMIFAIIILFIIQTIDGNVIGPKLLSNSINIHPVLVTISLIFGSAIGGLMGMLLAVPIGAFLKVLFCKFIDKRIAVKEAKS